jgi:hypothetical protein
MTRELGELLYQNPKIKVVDSRVGEKRPKLGGPKEQVIGDGDVFLVANDACMVVGHDAEHTPTRPQHLALDRNIRVSNPRSFADDVRGLVVDSLQEVVQLSGNKFDGTILELGNAFVGGNVSTDREERTTTYHWFPIIHPANPWPSHWSDMRTFLHLTQRVFVKLVKGLRCTLLAPCR